MKPTPCNTSHRAFVQLLHTFELGKILEGTYGMGIMTAHYRRASHKSGWTTQQLLELSKAKSFYN